MLDINVVIIGDANAGIITANKLRIHTGNNVKISIIGKSEKTYFKPDGVLIPFNDIDYNETVRNTDSVLNYGIDRVKAFVTKINLDDKYVSLDNGKTLPYDYLVIATGDRLVPEDVPGYNDEVYHFYDMNNALKVKEGLNNFKGGKIVIGPASMPFQCPVAPAEFAFEVNKFLTNRNLRDKSEITLIMPSDDVLPFKSVSDFMKKGFSDKNINFIPKFKDPVIDGKNKEISSGDNKLKYDMLVLIPPHKGQKFLTESGLADETGYVNVDKFKLNYKDYDNVFVVGDAANFPMKVGALGHSEAAYVASKIAKDINGNLSNDLYDGFMGCSTVFTDNTGFTLSFDYNSKPTVNYASKTDYFIKYISANTYFSSILRGIL